MNKTLRFQWAVRASRPAARLVLVQDGRLLAGPSLPVPERRALEAWLAAAKFTGEVAATAWPPGLPVPVLLVGIGKTPEFHPARWRRAWAAAGRALANVRTLKTISCEWPAAA